VAWAPGFQVKIHDGPGMEVVDNICKTEKSFSVYNVIGI